MISSSRCKYRDILTFCRPSLPSIIYEISTARLNAQLDEKEFAQTQLGIRVAPLMSRVTSARCPGSFIKPGFDRDCDRPIPDSGYVNASHKLR